MSTLGKGEAMYIFLRLAYAGSHLQVPSMLPRLVSYVQACCEAVNILETFVGVSKLPVEMNGDIQASQTTVSCSSSTVLGSPFSRGPPINHNSWRCNFLKSDLSSCEEKRPM